MTITKTFSALSLALLLAACQPGADTDSDDAMMEGESSSAVAESSESSADAMMEGESSMTFVGGSSILDHDGGFTDFSVDLGNSADLINSTVTATVQLDSVYTDSDGLTEHLKTEEFFDVATYPTASFTSTEITAEGDDYTIVGDLTIKGVTKSVIMNATMEDDVFTASFDIPRKEFGIGNDSYGDKILDEFVPVEVVVYIQ